MTRTLTSACLVTRLRSEAVAVAVPPLVADRLQVPRGAIGRLDERLRGSGATLPRPLVQPLARLGRWVMRDALRAHR
eukprot:SAG11_NODE_3170_length_2637_cov_4.585500_1_plen_77_part_00